MIVCSCNVLTDQDVRTALSAERTPRTTGQVYGCLGCSAQCGRCARTIPRIMAEASGRAPAPHTGLSVDAAMTAPGTPAAPCCPSAQPRGSTAARSLYTGYCVL